MSWGDHMRRALSLAEEGRYGASPNPMVGAVVLDPQGGVVGEGAHRKCGGPHAEVEALAAAGANAFGGTLVVTLEPCVHHGRTPPCVDAILAAAVRRVVIGCRDPNPAVRGRGVEALRAAGLEVIEDVEVGACKEVNRRFFHYMERGVPYTTLKMAVTLDGKLAARGGRSRWITSESSRREGYALREEYDSLLVGVRTILADDPRLLRHLGLNPDHHLRRVVLDSRLRTPPECTLLRHEPGDVVLFCSERADPSNRRALESVGATVVEVGGDERGRCDLRQVAKWLGARGISSLLVEGGGETHWSFLKEGLAQRVHAFLAPMLMGGKEAISAVGGLGFASPQEAVKLDFVEVRRLDGDVVLIAEVVRV